MKSFENLTPLLKQYYAIKNQHPDRILFYRMGDFYELFGEDAVKASGVLGIALTSRDRGENGKVPLAGVPYHTLDRYLTKLLKEGFKVAVCDQVEDPKKAKGIVKREVVEVFTPGSITLESALESGKPNYLAALNIQNSQAGIALLDISTGKFLIDEILETELIEFLTFHSPSEIIFPELLRSNLSEALKNAFPSTSVTPIDDYRFDSSLSFNMLTAHFKLNNLDGFGLGNISISLGCAGAAFSYIKDLKLGKIGQVTRLQKIQRGNKMALDIATIRNLELIETPYQGYKNSLSYFLDKTRTAMGKRLMRNWLLTPLIKSSLILERQQAVKAMRENPKTHDKILSTLEGLPDLERLASRISMKKAGPRDFVQLKNCLGKIEALNPICKDIKSDLIRSKLQNIPDFSDIISLLDSALIDDSPMNVSDGGCFKKGYSAKLDSQTKEIDEARQFIHDLQKQERDRTGIASLKVGFNRVFGYFIEVTKPHLSKIPSNYIRKQTLVSAERFVTEELKIKEELILDAEDRIKELEFKLFEDLTSRISEKIAEYQQAAEAIAEIDSISSLASLLTLQGYILPKITDSDEIVIKGSRHPVLESLLPPGKFVSNDISINSASRRISVITGPNMGGKSTYLRQAGILVLMSQIGSPIPAENATVGICDRIFTRVGASDDISRGRSTFMVEMTEAASILNNATDKSLILIDELGRGTSTFDGLAIAWSLLEFLQNINGKKARTFFTTHYHELIALADKYEGVINLHADVKQWQENIIFLYKIVEGGCDDSYGIQVAKLAGLPERLLNRAREILKMLESGQLHANDNSRTNYEPMSYQISLFSPADNEIMEIISKIAVENLTPVEALNILNELVEKLKKYPNHAKN